MLLTNYGRNNKVVDRALKITYTWDPEPLSTRKRLVLTQGQGDTPSTYRQVTTSYCKVYRRARKSYRYVGMTYEAACACATTLATLYTHETRLVTRVNRFDVRGASPDDIIDTGEWEIYRYTKGVNVCGANIEVYHTEGGIWEVQIDVDERDTAIGELELDGEGNATVTDPAVLFTWVGGRFYDEDSSAHVEGGGE